MMTVGTGQYYSEVMRYELHAFFSLSPFYGSQNIDSRESFNMQTFWATLPPSGCLAFNKPTTDGDAQLHPSPFGEFNMESAAAGNHRLWLRFRTMLKGKMEKLIRFHNMKLLFLCNTCNIELNLQCDLVSQSRVSEQLMSFLQSAIFSWDPINEQQSVANLQQPTPSRSKTHKYEKNRF